VEDGPALRYYRSLVGSWSGALTLFVTDAGALRAATLATRSRIRTMALLSGTLGAARMATTLEAVSERRFRHTTRVAKWRATLFDSEEEIAIEDDGRSFRMTGVQRSWPGRREPLSGEGEIDATATGAVYRIPWFGVELIQRTTIVPEGLELTQETPWSRAAVLLRRERR
jgi:hypothetical protein